MIAISRFLLQPYVVILSTELSALDKLGGYSIRVDFN